MPFARTWSKSEVQSAIQRAEGARFSSFVTVWGGLESHHWKDIYHGQTGKLIKTIQKYNPPKSEAEKVSDDVGHTLRNHVKGKQAPEYVGTKSCFDDMNSCLGATAEALNSTKGQAALKSFDDDPDVVDRRINAAVSGNWYGDSGDGAKKKIEKVAVVVMRLGSDTLWIHTSYPMHFVA